MLRATLLIISLITYAWTAGYRWNSTASFPTGLWKISKPFNPSTDKFKTISFCPPNTPVFILAKQRDYIGAGLLSCASGFQPMIKKVIAVAGDTISITDQGITVNNQSLANSKPLNIDNKQRPLPQAQGELVAAGFIWVLSDYSPTSFDSRYFGPIAVSDVLGVIEPLFIF